MNNIEIVPTQDYNRIFESMKLIKLGDPGVEIIVQQVSELQETYSKLIKQTFVEAFNGVSPEDIATFKNVAKQMYANSIGVDSTEIDGDL